MYPVSRSLPFAASDQLTKLHDLPQAMEAPDTAEPDKREKKIAARYNRMIGERKFSAFWIDAPTRASTGTRKRPFVERGTLKTDKLIQTAPF
jgi:hypothetical protein